MIPGSNLFNIAARAIRSQTVGYLQANGRATNAVGQWVSTFAQPVTVIASVQAVDKLKYVQMGLDLQKDYCMIFTPWKVFDLERDATSDMFVVDGVRWQISSQTDWFSRDGWCQNLCVKIKKSVTPPGVSA